MEKLIDVIFPILVIIGVAPFMLLGASLVFWLVDWQDENKKR